VKDKRQLEMPFDSIAALERVEPKGKACKHPQKSIRREMLIDTCLLCGATHTVNPNGMLRIEGPWTLKPSPDVFTAAQLAAVATAAPQFPVLDWGHAEVDKQLTPNDLSEDQQIVYKGITKWLTFNGAVPKKLCPGCRDGIGCLFPVPCVVGKENLLRIGGLGGSGKSTLIGVLAAQLSGKLVAYATYTGRASSVLARKLRAAGVHVTSHQAKPPDYEGRDPNRMFLDPHEMKLPFCGTLHKLLYRPIINDKEEVVGWRKREKLDRPYDLLVVDECFHYKQRVLTEDGWISIGVLVNTKRKCRVWAYNRQTGALELRPIVRWLRHRAPKELVQINVGRTGSMRDARLLRCTPEHKILTPTGYKRAGELKVGDELVVRGRHLTPTQFSVLVGSMLGDGSMNRHALRNSPQPKLTQGEDQIEWLKFKQGIFGDLAGKLTRTASGFTPTRIFGTSQSESLIRLVVLRNRCPIAGIIQAAVDDGLRRIRFSLGSMNLR
jgi:hypothetical protein